jgi:hypothetical protein
MDGVKWHVGGFFGGCAGKIESFEIKKHRSNTGVGDTVVTTGEN